MQHPVRVALGLGVGHLDGLEPAAREPRGAVPVHDVRLEPAHHHRRELIRIGADAAGEALVVQHLQERGEGFRVAVVRRRREEQLVLEMRGEQADGVRAIRVRRVPPAAGGGHVMRLVDDQQVEGPGEDRPAGRGQHVAEEAQGALALEVVDGGDEAREVRPRIHVQAPAAPQLLHQRGVDDAEVQAELVAHLVAPLDLQRGRAGDQDRMHPLAEDQLLGHQPGLDGLPEAHVVGDEQVGARHLDGAHHRIELIVLDGDAGAEGGLERGDVGGGDGAPQYRVEEGVQVARIVEAPGRVGQPLGLVDAGAGLDLPDDAQLVAEGVVLDRREADQVLRRLLETRSEDVARQAGGEDILDDEGSPAHLNQLADRRHGDHPDMLRSRARRGLFYHILTLTLLPGPGRPPRDR